MGKGSLFPICQMSRNFGLGSRDMSRAGQTALDRAAADRELSFSSAATNAERWSLFTAFAKEQGINRMEHITTGLVQQYGQGLANQVEAGQLAAATAQNRVSAVNSVMQLATKQQWQSVSPTRDCGIAQRCAVRSESPAALDRSVYNAAHGLVREQASVRSASVVELARELGLRSKEASLLDARSALAQAHKISFVTITEGTKGGRSRDVPITSEKQLSALSRAAEAQGSARAVMAPEQDWKSWRNGELRDAREIVKSETGGGLHDLRAAYTCERYEQLTGNQAPVAGGEIRDRGSDLAAREQISSELGHGRIDVVSEYIGGR